MCNVHKYGLWQTCVKDDAKCIRVTTSIRVLCNQPTSMTKRCQSTTMLDLQIFQLHRISFQWHRSHMLVVGSQNICELQIGVMGEFWKLWGWRRTRDRHNWRNWLMIHDDHYSCLLWLIACCEGIMNIGQAEKERRRGGIKHILSNNTSTRSDD